MRSLFPVLFVFFLTVSAYAGPERLHLFDIATELPSTFVDTYGLATRSTEIGKWATVAAFTTVLIANDEKVLLETQRLGRKWNIATVDNLKPLIKINDFSLLRGPTDFSSGLYFLGDGWIHLSTAAAFLATGALSDQTRPFNTGIQLFHGLTASTITSQILKRVAGREGPNARTQSGGAWRPFPSQTAYSKSRTRYDAFPSGHVMVTTLSFTIIRGNYPEYESMLWPLQLTYMSALTFGMINNGIHWAGDYPLGIILGYYFGKSSLRRHSKDNAQSVSARPTFEPEIFPSVDSAGSLMTNFRWEL